MEHHGHHHHHDHHTHESAEPFAPAAENLLLDIALHVRAGEVRLSEMPDIGEIAELEERHDIKNLRARLGDAYPELGFMGEAAVISAYAGQASELPVSHPRYNHADDHEHDDGCGKAHGPIRKAMESFERKVLGRIRNQRVRLVAAMAFRGSSLILCPGDDLAAIGLQVYGAFSGNAGHDDHGHAEHVAILPRGPRIDLAKGTAVISSLPLDIPVRHADMPDTPEHKAWKERTLDPELPPRQPKPERVKTKERPSRLRRLALVGMAAAAFAGVFTASGTHGEKSNPIAGTPNVGVAEVPPAQPEIKEVPAAPVVLREATVQKGDSQWELIEQDVRDTLGHDGRTPLVNALAHISVQANKGEVIDPGQKIWLPADTVIRAVHDAVTNPGTANAKLVGDINILNAQDSFASPQAAAAASRIMAYVAA